MTGANDWQSLATHRHPGHSQTLLGTANHMAQRPPSAYTYGVLMTTGNFNGVRSASAGRRRHYHDQTLASALCMVLNSTDISLIA